MKGPVLGRTGLCFAVASRFLSLECKKLFWRLPTPAGMYTYRKSWLPGLAAALFRRKSGLAWAAGARWLQVMRFSYFFLSFFFSFSILLKYLQQ